MYIFYKMLSMQTLLLLLCASHNEAARILAVFPTPAFSHQMFFRPYTQELARRGHEVTVITPIPAFPPGKSPENLKEIDVSNRSIALWQEKQTNKCFGEEYIKNGMEKILKTLVDIFESLIQQDGVRKLIESGDKFDLLLLEAWLRLPLAFTAIFKAPVIRISSFGPMLGLTELFGGPTHPILYPRSFDNQLYNLTSWEAIYKLYSKMLQSKVYEKISKMSDDMLKRNFGPEFPDLDELDQNNDVLLLNVHRIWEGNHPAPTNVVYLGGLHVKPSRELPEDLQKYLDASENGVIHVSFGTNVIPSMLPEAMIETFFRVLSRLPYDVLWKWDKDSMPRHSKNIRVMQWIPQADLLRHPKVQLFITQAGLHSIDEAIDAGVPILGVPIIADQWYNAENCVRQGIGAMVQMDVCEEDLREAILTVIGDDRYRSNVVRLRQLVLDAPLPPLQRAVLWAERVLRARAPRTPPHPHAPLHFDLDLLAAVLLVCGAAIIVLAIAVYYLIKYVFLIRLKMFFVNK